MLTATPLLRNVVLTLLVLTASCVLACESHAARYVKAEISLDGKILLVGSRGDNGQPDADEVWDYLKTITFKRTEEFLALKFKDDAKEAVLTSNAPKGGPGTIVIDMGYGGKTTTRELTLIRVPRDENGGEWRLDPAQIDKLFSRRFLRRSDAARLKNPQNYRR